MKILAYSSVKGDLVLDPFVGSGQIPFVSRAMGRKYIGFEKERKSYLFALKRLENNLYLIPSRKRGVSKRAV